MSIIGSLIRDAFKQKEKTNKSHAGQKELVFENIQQAEGGVIIGFTTGSEGDALAKLTKELLRPFAEIASRIVIIDTSKQDIFFRLKDVFREPIWFAASYFGSGQNISITKANQPANLWESSGIPFVRFYGDTPAYFPDRHVANYKNSINAYWDRAHIKFYRCWFDNQALSVLLPGAPIEKTSIDNIDIESKLSGKIIFPKNGNSPTALRSYWRSTLPSTISNALNSISDEITSNQFINFEPCFDDRLIRHFADIGVELATLPSVLCFLVAQLDDYLRRVKSTMIAESILDFPVIIRGCNWEHINFSNTRASYENCSDYSTTQYLLDKAPALIDMSPNTMHMKHDRIMRAVGRGTAFLTNKQDFLDSVFQDSKRFTFEFNKNSISSLVDKYVSDLPAAIELGIEQSLILRPTMDESFYVESLLTAIHAITLRCAERPPGTQNFVIYPPREYVGKQPRQSLNLL